MQAQKVALSVEEAAEYTGYTKNYLYKLVHLGQIPHYKPFGRKGKLFFKPAELETFIFRGRQPANYEEARK